jgi:uncharacterized protein GlcG (DUF336 family)
MLVLPEGGAFGIFALTEWSYHGSKSFGAPFGIFSFCAVRTDAGIRRSATACSGTRFVASERMDGVSPANIQYAEGKAFAAVMQRQTTEQLGQLVKDRPDRYYAIQAMNPGKMYLVGGGEPLITDGVLVGAVGVAGLAQYEDEAAGRAGMAAWERMRPKR